MNNEPTASGEPSHKAEPVAWAMFVDGDFWDAIHPEEHDRVEGKYTVPLYTAPQPHPAKKLTGAVGSLSDEEIEIVVDEVINNLPPDDLKGKHSNFYRLFARAILRKAQEK
jgi:hypothetical protein